jgi:flagellar biosynthesis GTPase FlhF
MKTQAILGKTSTYVVLSRVKYHPADRTLQFLTFSAATAKQCVIVFSDTQTIGSAHDDDGYRRVVDSYASEHIVQRYHRERIITDKARHAEAERLAAQQAREAKAAAEAQSAAEKQQKAEEEKQRLRDKRAADRARKARQAAKEAKEKEAKEKAHAEEVRKRQAADAAARKAKAKAAADKKAKMPQLYKEWKATCEKAKACPPMTLKKFPSPPKEACDCHLIGCVQRKKDTGLGACRHDVEALLRASGEFDHNWLRHERLAWHPDRFGRKCSPEWQEVGKKKATELFEIYEDLIEGR